MSGSWQRSACASVPSGTLSRVVRWLFVATVTAIAATNLSGGLRLGATPGSAGAAQQTTGQGGLWQDVAESGISSAVATPATGTRHRRVALDADRLTALLASTPRELSNTPGAVATLLELPWPDGGSRTFRIEESPVMDPVLGARFPELQTYRGYGVDDPTASLRFDWTPAGFHALVLSADGTVYIDPEARGNVVDYRSYFLRDQARADDSQFRCGVTGDALAPFDDERTEAFTQLAGTQLRTYRLAVAATGGYTAFHGGTIPGALNGIVTTINRVNALFERDAAVHMNLIANNDVIVYTNAATDPYTDGTPSTMLNENQTNLTAVIGAANYDIGHVFGGSGGGGIAQVGAVCGVSKARAASASSSPTGDSFNVQLVAHEIGHQFGATHTFNGTTSNCGGGNRSAGSAYKPGSGSTIMAYAGICGAENLQSQRDAYFHSGSQAQMASFIGGGGSSCAVATATGNTPPDVSAGADFTIPQSTPFILNAIGSDGDGDALTYTWEERDLGTASPPNTDDGSRPLFRSYLPSSSTSRTFPATARLLANQFTSLGESLPTTTRAMTFRVTVRDNRANGGGTGYDDMVLNVRSDSGPFVVTQPNSAVSWTGGSQQLITWDVANTQLPPVSTICGRDLSVHRRRTHVSDCPLSRHAKRWVRNGHAAKRVDQ